MAAYGDDAGFTAWLAEQGYTLPDTAPAPAVLRARGSAYVDSYEPQWTGQRTGGVMQELAWPRTGASANCVQSIPSDLIPPAVVNAAYRAGWLEASTPGVLVGATAAPGQRIQMQQVDVIKRQFFDDGKATVGDGPSFIDSMIDGWLSTFICDATKTGVFMWTLGS